VSLGVYTAIIGVVGSAFIIFYPLNNKKMIEIEEDLKARRLALQ
jgi:Na+/melibiose symporter-like transporter